MMKSLSLRIAFIGNALPRRCGIATFTTDLQQAVAVADPRSETTIVAMNDLGLDYAYPSAVSLKVRDNTIADYVHAADFLNARKFDVVCLQHEFGIFGGKAGCYVMELLSRLKAPVVTTLHTVLATPNPAQFAVLCDVANASSRVVVMAEKARRLLESVYHVPIHKIDVIPHGIPDVAFVNPDEAKAEYGLSGRTVILTFGLLTPNKGVEVMIDAMPDILEGRPDALYVVLGATHPNLIRDQGEAYRDSLQRRVRDLGIGDHVLFLNQFVDQPTLLRYLSACDVYVTPYLNEEQMTSGTLAYSFGLGNAVVSTPYWHAQELLSDGSGILVPFGDDRATGNAIAELLADEPRRQAMRVRAYADSRPMIWQCTAERYLETFERALPSNRVETVSGFETEMRDIAATPPEIKMEHLLSMCDETGLLQHAVHCVPDRDHGYCVDDNARALLLACTLNRLGEACLPEVLMARLASFVHHAWNPDTRRFRNFMSFDRRWLEDQGSEDSHGRTLWALGVCARENSSLSRRDWADSLFSEALPAVERFSSPRAWAFTLLGLDAYCAGIVHDSVAACMRRVLAERLLSLFEANATDDWQWYEDSLAYDNARLPQALIVAGMATGRTEYVDAGVRSLKWLMKMQTAPSGCFRPVGTASFGMLRTPPKLFDQQPVEAAATISACLAAWCADRNPLWKVKVSRAFAWFLGDNDLSLPLVDTETGSCKDGLHPDRVNENMGAESVWSYLFGLCEVRQMMRLGVDRITAKTVSGNAA